MKISFPNDKKIAAAVSGGIDSMVMLSLFLQHGIKPLVVTIDHGIRGDEGRLDAKFVQAFAETHGLECLVYTVDVPAAQQKSGYSTELQARVLRYEIFDQILQEKKADVISLAHHLSDQTETIFMRIMRGTGVRGLAGIADREGYIHPLLSYTRADIEQYAFRKSVQFREDKTNLWDAYLRNFIRNRVLPIVEQRSPNVARQIEKLAASAKETEDFIATFLIPFEKIGEKVVLCGGILEAHNAVVKRSILAAFKELGMSQDVEEPALNAVCALKSKQSGAMADMGQGYFVRREYSTLVIEKAIEKQSYEKPFLVSETYNFGCRYDFIVAKELLSGCTFDANKIPLGTVVRTRREGDKFRKFKGGEKSLSDYFTDIKLKREERDTWLLLACGETVLAILGLEISDDVKVDDTTKQMITVKRSHL